MKTFNNKFAKKCFIVIFSMFILTNCTDDFLTQENPNAEESTFDELGDTEAVLTTLYNNLLNHFILDFIFEGLTSDLAAPRNTRIDVNRGQVSFRNINNYEFDNQTASVERKWNALYRGIFLANQVIFGLEELEPSIVSTEDRNVWVDQMAQARFFRGMYHFYLHSTYNNGNIIIKDTFIPSALETSSTVSSSADVIEFYLEDLEYAYENLPMPDAITNEEKGEVSKGVAAMLLANHYLFQEEYASAIPLYEEVINDFGYALADPSIMFTTAGEFNSESIFEVNYTTEVNLEQGPFDETSFHNRFAQESSLFGGDGRYLPASWLLELYQEEPLDTITGNNNVDIVDNEGMVLGQRLRTISKRTSAMVVSIKDEESLYYGETVTNVRAGGSFRYNANRGAARLSAFKKYTNHDIRTREQDSPDGNQRKSGKNVTILRLPEAYINYAECLIKTGGRTQEAIDAINEVRKRWDIELIGPSNGDITRQYNNVVYTDDTLMERLMYVEKPLELSVEGFATRTIDLRRWGIGTQRFTDLSTQVYSLEDYSPVAGGNAHASSILIKGDLGVAPHTQFEEAARNYSNFNGYLPIPQDERLNNNGLPLQ